MTLGELLRHTGEFLLARYREVVETVLRFKDSREKLIRRAVIALLPRLAAFAPERFAQDYLSKCISHLLSVLRHPSERGAAFGAIADMATSLAAVGCAGGFRDCLPAIAAQVRDAVAPRGGPGGALSSSTPKLASAAGGKGGVGGGPVPEALSCVGALSQALQGLWKPYASALLESMVMTGLSETLVRSLAAIAESLPELLEDIQTCLLDLLSLVLTNRPFSPATPRARVAGLVSALASSELQGAPRVRLALNTLGSFDFGRVSLLEFVRDHILPYVDDGDKEVRQAAALACCRVLERHAATAAAAESRRSAAAAGGGAGDGAGGANGYAAAGMNGYGGAAFGGVGGACAGVSARQARGIEAVVGRLLMAAVADTSEHVRRAVLKREEAAFLLDCLISAAPKLILPYISPIQKALVAKLRGGGLAAAAAAGGGGGGAAGAMGLSASLGGGGGLLGQTAVGSAPGTGGSMHLVSSLGSLAGAGGGGLGGGGGGGGPVGGGGGKDRASEAGVVRSVLATLGQLATVAGTSFTPYVPEVGGGFF
ncbi:target of rapamycin kinase [Raphidocelis subcapitata]|uniref:Target of rapamycin kinase n=1 Tax=Raphidocelis subcapitata TaxID=307507 RepID=A0A2V0PLL6_9CHLO|nr:target of rapamycin kinase [Raphidocelis subcapitata]|eukprot:GBG00672.1 target of rapamycin kinase [Raphidocelis subcapitata]